MCFLHRQRDPRVRRLLVIANLCLVAGLLPRLFPEPASQQMRIVLHAASGVLLGIAIAMNFSGFRLARRCAQNQAGDGL
ncbi:MAG TPA: hypothetical protein VHX20_15045 [Terracidiphilus sp.]|jgi:hypothetical protein|nr:hypothetical protein [Terracidiphilus sp.]